MAELLGLVILVLLAGGFAAAIFAPRRRERAGRRGLGSGSPEGATGLPAGRSTLAGPPDGGGTGRGAGGGPAGADGRARGGAGRAGDTGQAGGAGRADGDGPSDGAGAATPASGQAEGLAADLRSTVRRAKAAGGRLPVAAVPAVREVEDVMRPLLTYLVARPGNPEELRQATVIVREHLADALDRYLALPADYLASARTPEGRTVAEELVEQLRLLREGAQQLATAVYDGDAQQLAVGRRFLDAKFRRSDLDL